MLLATGKMAVCLDGSQAAAALAVIDGITASLARGMAAPLPPRALPSVGLRRAEQANRPAHHASFTVLTRSLRRTAFPGRRH